MRRGGGHIKLEELIEKIAREDMEKKIKSTQKTLQDFRLELEIINKFFETGDPNLFYRFSADHRIKRQDTMKKIAKSRKEEIEEVIKNVEKQIPKTEQEKQRLFEQFKELVRKTRVHDIFFNKMEDVACTAYDERQLFPELHEDFIAIHNFNSSGNGGFRSRFTTLWFDILDKGEINGSPAWLFEVGVATYYDASIRGIKRKRYLAGYDDGHLFLTQVYSTCQNVKEALDRIIPKAVKQAIAAGKEVKRQGDLWFVKTKIKIKDPEVEGFKMMEIRPGHKGMYNSKRKLAVGKIIHREHGTLDLGTEYAWKVYRNHMVSRQRYGYD